MTFFSLISPKRHLPQNSVPFGMDSSAGDVFSLVVLPILGRKSPLLPISEVLFSLCGLLPGFPFEFMYFIVQKTVVFIYVPANCIQHEFLVHLFRGTVIEPPKFFVFLYVPEMSLRLYGADLAVQYPFLALYVGMGFLPQFPSVMAYVIMPVLGNLALHVVMLPNVLLLGVKKTHGLQFTVPCAFTLFY